MKIADNIAAAIKNGELVNNNAQLNAINGLDELLKQLNDETQNTSKIWGLWSKKNKNIIKGIYLWGGVGGGKTMLMDMFYKQINNKQKYRTHFHEFMLSVHQKIHEWRQKNNDEIDPLPIIAKGIAEENKIICFDEFTVTDVADAMILSKLFTNLFECGVTIVATSNVEPDKLYKDGLNRSWFMPFIEIVKNKMNVIQLNTQVDHRQQKLQKAQFYMYGENAEKKFNDLWDEMTFGLEIHLAQIEHKGRVLEFPQTCGGIVKSDFDTICKTALGAIDYIAMAGRFHTLFLDNLTPINSDDRNTAKRFITLIDTWYDNRKILIINARKPHK